MILEGWRCARAGLVWFIFVDGRQTRLNKAVDMWKKSPWIRKRPWGGFCENWLHFTRVKSMFGLHSCQTPCQEGRTAETNSLFWTATCWFFLPTSKELFRTESFHWEFCWLPVERVWLGSACCCCCIWILSASEAAFSSLIFAALFLSWCEYRCGPAICTRKESSMYSNLEWWHPIVRRCMYKYGNAVWFGQNGRKEVKQEVPATLVSVSTV